jgi:hypothetical protein
MSISDHTLNIIMAICALIAIVVTVVFYFLQRKRKEISFRILYQIDLLSRNEQLENKVKILYEGVEVTNIQILTIKVVNSGNIPIVKSDFDTPLKLELNGKVRILGLERISANPPYLEVSYETNHNYLLVEPLLLNSRDWLIFKLIAEGRVTSIKASGRIKDIHTIKNWEDKKSAFDLYMTFCMGGFTVLLLLAAVFITPQSHQSKTDNTIFLTVAFGLLILMIVFGVLIFREKTRKKN